MILNARPSATLSPPAISGKLVWLLATARQRSHLTEPPGCTSPYLECGAEDRAWLGATHPDFHRAWAGAVGQTGSPCVSMGSRRSRLRSWEAGGKGAEMQPPEKRQVVWEVLAQFWVDTSYDAGELDEFADRLAQCGFSIRELDRITQREMCGAFAIFTLAVFASAGMALPDFPREQARKNVAAWLSRPRLLTFLNPLWVLGYIAARCFLRPTWLDLRGRVARRLGAPAA